MRKPRRTYRTVRENARPGLKVDYDRSRHPTGWTVPLAAILMPGLVLWMLSPSATLPGSLIALAGIVAFMLVVEAVDRLPRRR